MANNVELTFSADTQTASRNLDKLGDSVNDMGRDLDGAKDKAAKFDAGIDGVGDTLGSSESKLVAANDLIGGLSETMGFALPPQAGMIMGFADMAGGMEGLLVPALKKGAAGMKGLNAVMRANPILSVITVIGLLTAAFVVAYKKSETFRNIVHGAMDGVKKAVEGLGRAFEWLMDTTGKVFDFIMDKAKWLWEHSPIGLLVNSLDKIGGFVGKVGGAIGIPGFANGGQYTGGPMIVGERGPELMIPGGPGTVVPNHRLGGGGTTEVVLRVEGDSAMAEAIRKMVRVQGGGNVQQAFGRA